MRKALVSAGITAALLIAALPGATGGAASTASLAACPAAGGVKPLLRGLVDRNHFPPATNLQGSAIDVKWSDLEPSGPGLIAANPIDGAIAAAGCAPLRIRLLAGISAPEWVKQASGGDVNVINPFDGKPGTIGRFWTDPFRQAYDNLQSELSAAYDSVPNVDEIVVSRCSMFYPEPFLRGTSIRSNVTSLLAAGFNTAADQQCQLEEIDSSLQSWKTVRVGVSFNPYQFINPDGTTGSDVGYTEQVMGYCRYVAGRRCVLENDSIRDPMSGLPTAYAPMYDAMSGAAGPVHVTVGGLDVVVPLGAPLAFQIAVMLRNGDFWGTLVWARQHHAASVELPLDGTYPTSGGSGAPAWQTLPEVAAWFQEDPVITATALAAGEGKATNGLQLGTLTLDELAALDTIGGYGDVGAVPFDNVTAEVRWPDGVADTALLTTGSGTPAATVACPLQRWCVVTIESGGHAFAEEAPSTAAAINASPLAGGLAYVPADGLSPSTTPIISVGDAPLSLTKLKASLTRTPRKVWTVVAFADADPGGVSSDYSVKVTWGDGSSTMLSASVASRGFSAGATHTYAKAGTYLVYVAVADAGGATVAGHISTKVA